MTTLDKDLKYDEVKAVNNATINVDTAKGIVEAFAAAIGNKDSVGDIIVPGAFAKSLQRRKPRVVWGHDWNSPIGKVLEIEEIPPTDPRIPAKMKAMNVGGLYVKVQFNLGSARGKEAFNDVLFYGTEQEWSIGYKTLRKNYDPDRQANVLHEVELYEVSPVLHGANNLTSTISIKDGTVTQESVEAGAVTGMDIKDNTFYLTDSNTSSTWSGGGMSGTSWDFQVNEKTFGTVAPPELQRTQGAVPTMEEKLRKAFTSAFGEISDLKLMDDGQAVFQRGDSTWAVKYRIDGPKLMVTRPEKVTVRTVVEPVATEEQSYHGDDEEMARKGGCGDDCNCGHGSKSDRAVVINVSADIDTESFEAVEAQVKRLLEAETKAGRVISTGNMSKLSKAAGMLNEVIQSGTMMTDERPPMQKKDGQDLLAQYKTGEADAEDHIEMVFGEGDSGKSVWLHPDGENPTLEKVIDLLDGLEPLAVKHGWTLLAPTQKQLDSGECGLGIKFSTDDGILDQVKSLDALLKAADCKVSISTEEMKSESKVDLNE